MLWEPINALQRGCLALFLTAIMAVRSEVCRGGKYKPEQFPVPLDRQQEIFKAANKTPNNIEYVGCGYDMYGGSDIDEHAGFSLNNYRGPILDTYAIAQGVLKGQPENLGIWVSSEFQCDISSELTSIDTRQKLESIVGSQTKNGDGGIFSSSLTESNRTDNILNTLMQFRKIIVKKYKCTVYSAGIITNNTRETMKRFHNIIRRLMDGCKGVWKEDDCSLEKYRANMNDDGCVSCVEPWMRFFVDFGTHITSRVTMGGIIRNFSNLGQKSARRKQSTVEHTVTMSSSWFGLSQSKSDNTSKKEYRDSRHGSEDDILQYTVGPEPDDGSLPPEAFEEWVRKVAQNPVPIKTDFIPLYELMVDDASIKVYKDALRYYARFKGVDIADDTLTNQGFKSSILHLLKESTVVVRNGAGKVNRDVCSGKSRVVFGFGVNLNEKRQILQSKLCYSGLNACILDQNNDVKSSFIVAYCDQSKDYDFTQKIIRGGTADGTYSEVLCPRNSVIGMGAIIQFQHPLTILTCPKGNSGCGFPNLGPNGIIWVVCFPHSTFGINMYETKANVVTSGKDMECRPGHRIINGFYFSAGDTDNVVSASACGKFEAKCRPTSTIGVRSVTYVICAN